MNREEIDFLVIENLAGMVWVANLAGLELHTPQWTVGPRGAVKAPTCWCSISIRARRPHRQVPGGGLPVARGVGRRRAHRVPEDQRFEGHAGQRADTARRARAHLGIRAGVGRQAGRETSQADHRGDGQGGTARASLRGLEPEQHGQNHICVYSLRARPEPRVSTPVTWEEVEGEQPLNFTAPDVLERVERLGDLHADTLDAATPLPG